MRSSWARWILVAGSVAGRALPAPGSPCHAVASEVNRFEVLGTGSEDELGHWDVILEATGVHVDELLSVRSPGSHEPARVRVFDHAGAWRRRLDQDEQPRLAGWDRVWYGADTDTVYVVRQPTAYETHQQLILGAVLQRFATRSEKNEADWRGSFAIGLGIHLSHHAFEDGRLELGVVPPITMADYTSQAIEPFDPSETNVHLDLAEHTTDRRVTFALTRYALLGSDRRLRSRFLKLGLGKSGSKLDAGGAVRLFGPPQELASGVRAFLLAHPEPWTRRTGSWGPEGTAALAGNPAREPIAFATLKGAAKELSLRCDPEGNAYGAAVVHYQDETHYEAFSLFRGQLEHFRRNESGYEDLGTVPVMGAGFVELRRARDRVKVRLDGRKAFEIDARPGAWGVAAFEGLVVFRDVSWK